MKTKADFLKKEQAEAEQIRNKLEKERTLKE
jgi:hypothetical protein